MLEKDQVDLLRKGRNILTVYRCTKHLQTGEQVGQIDVILEGLRKSDLAVKEEQ